MRLLGLKWLTWRLYPESYRIDMVKEAQRFYRLFLGVDMPEDKLKKALYR
jgi:iron complex transport system substrate-binding protein